MATNHGEKPPVPVDASAGYEKRDASIRGLIQFAFWMALVIVATLVAMHFAFDAFKKATPLGPTMSPMVKQGARMIPPAPLLQAHPHQELEDYCQAQQQQVTTYGWVDQPSGVVRIPIDRAMDLILARGLPTRPAGEAAAAGAPEIAPATVAGQTDVQGQCGYLTEPSLADRERAAHEKAVAEGKEE